MKIKEGFVLRTVCEDNLVVPIGEASVDFKSVIKLNETGVFIWKLLEKDADIDTIVAAMLKEYNAEEEVIRADVEAFCERLSIAGITE